MMRACAVAVAVWLAVPVSGNAQTPAKKPKTPAPADAKAAASAPPQAILPEGYSYSSRARRDPFVSLLRRGTDSASAVPTVRAAGLRGMGIGEVTLKGTMASRGSYVAIVQGSDTKTYIVRPGEQLLDGTIRAITADALVILQQVHDPLAPDKQREVRKVLRQTEEAR